MEGHGFGGAGGSAPDGGRHGGTAHDRHGPGGQRLVGSMRRAGWSDLAPWVLLWTLFAAGVVALLAGV